ncbi:snoaL-like polyketide cyclase family protein [Paraburkholderia fungorum]|jgi:predicted ester cyclase|uniref:Ester cyclase n=1 Tax=Paraburkholderia fungorum TaxID=134537 RepID=A0AAJ3SJK4_9BURK|nr:ester cyclase [Paraburkholderia fungorum]AJZ63374.1 snoaL-like polyketide cyclase family protein [Paraburkholderia fungorum]MBB5541552.1 putative ester cyclase [Paraburkholderia fungorum]MDT8842380.1 ester cyclase [Paraburkholderia fungorum]PNE54689.1 ester cyclase [Paraburkholderia fungorum]PRZ45115.1 SnoaL-like polyketide cyclase [Paraburkholderia fungorum]
MTVPTDEAVTREAIEGLYRAFEQKSVPLLRKVVTPDWEYVPEPVGVSPGPDQMVPIFATLATALPDMKIAILDVLIHGDRVGVRAEVSGTQTGELLGIAASSRHISFAIHSFHQMRGSLIAKTWHLEDWLSVFRQLGQLPPTLGRS